MLRHWKVFSGLKKPILSSIASRNFHGIGRAGMLHVGNWCHDFWEWLTVFCLL